MKNRLLPVIFLLALFFPLSTASAATSPGVRSFGAQTSVSGGRALGAQTSVSGSRRSFGIQTSVLGVPWTGRYKIVKGDTLWDISKVRLSDPFAWPRIWKKNQFIHNPNLIYPGQVIKLPQGVSIAPRVKVVKKEEVPAPPVEERETGPFVSKGTTLMTRPHVTEGKIITIPPPQTKQPVANEETVLEAGFVDEGGIRTRTIEGSPVPQSLYGLFDELYVKTDGVKAGDRFIIGRYAGEVKDPGTGDTIGKMVKVLGVLKIEGQKDGFMLGSITKAFTDIKISDRLFPYREPVIVYEPVPANPKAYGVSGYIVALRDNMKDVSQADIVFIDRGAKDGVRPGDTFLVERPGGYANKELPIERPVPLPDVKTGLIQVVSVSAHTAAAKVVSSDGPLKTGYGIYYSRPK